MKTENTSSRKIKIGLDVDGVLADVIETWISYNNKIRTHITKSEIVEWDFWKRSRIEQFNFFEELSNCWKNWEIIPPTESQLSLDIDEMSKIGSVDIVTAREKSTNHYVKNWLRSKNIHYSKYVQVSEGPEKANLDYDVFIDDSPINAKEIVDASKNIIIYNQPWNLRFNDPHAKRIDRLKDSIPLLKSIADHQN